MSLPSDLREEKFREISAMHSQRTTQEGRENFLPFVAQMMPGFINGPHHKKMADAFERVINGDLKRLIINMPPRHSKSEFASVHLPAWFLGKNPDKKVIVASHKVDLAEGFSRRVRNMLDSADYKVLFPGIGLSADSTAAARWHTNKGGELYATGVSGKIAGKGADLFIIDDPHSEQDWMNPGAYENVWEWYVGGPRQRLQPGAAIIIVMTRWDMRDLTGRLQHQMSTQEVSDQWEVIELPAILPSGRPLWGNFWTIEELEATKATIPNQNWMAQYMQNPQSEEGALVKREWWKVWPHDDPPQCEYVIVSLDTALTATEVADYSAFTTWGVFKYPDDNGMEVNNLMLLDAFQDRYEFPELKRVALNYYNEQQPDCFLVEAKASGIPLIQEMRRQGFPISEFSPGGRNPNSGPRKDKISRVNAISDLFYSGHIWAPERNWANVVKDQFAAFPHGEWDDYVDSGTQAIMRFRQGGFLRIKSDWYEDALPIRKRAEFY